MYVTMVMVCSINGKITRGNNPFVSAFASTEDAQLFASLKQQAEVIVMGSKTYDVAKEKLVLSANTLRVVFTRNPNKYSPVPGQLEFTDETPKKLIERLEKKGYSQVLLAGGNQINAMFLKKGLVDKLRITLEPWILGKGKNMVDEIDVDTNFRLVSTKQLNTNGTVHLVYEKI